MIIARAPLRISFAGGGSDLKTFYSREGGVTLGVTIDKFVFTIVRPLPSLEMPVRYYESEIALEVDQIDHPLIWQALRMTEIEKGIQIATMSDVPAGTGLGDSGALIVSLLAALNAYAGKARSAARVAEEAWSIFESLGYPMGKQDMYLSAVGGLLLLEFNKDGSVITREIELESQEWSALERRLLLFYTGWSRNSTTILREQSSVSPEDVLTLVRHRKQEALDMYQCLTQGQLDSVGALLNEAWQSKRGAMRLESAREIDHIYNAALGAGALGGSVAGAGGGGYLLLYSPEDRIEAVRKTVMANGLREMSFQLTSRGSELVLGSRAVARIEQ